MLALAIALVALVVASALFLRGRSGDEPRGAAADLQYRRGNQRPVPTRGRIGRWITRA
jgi:hypothetical protein